MQNYCIIIILQLAINGVPLSLMCIPHVFVQMEGNILLRTRNHHFMWILWRIRCSRHAWSRSLIFHISETRNKEYRLQVYAVYHMFLPPEHALQGFRVVVHPYEQLLRRYSFSLINI